MTKESESTHEAAGDGSVHGAHDADTDDTKTSRDQVKPDTQDHPH
jgi:hypothetical protein